jgi:hypothetical protein
MRRPPSVGLVLAGPARKREEANGTRRSQLVDLRWRRRRPVRRKQEPRLLAGRCRGPLLCRSTTAGRPADSYLSGRWPDLRRGDDHPRRRSLPTAHEVARCRRRTPNLISACSSRPVPGANLNSFAIFLSASLALSRSIWCRTPSGASRRVPIRVCVCVCVKVCEAAISPGRTDVPSLKLCSKSSIYFRPSRLQGRTTARVESSCLSFAN